MGWAHVPRATLWMKRQGGQEGRHIGPALKQTHIWTELFSFYLFYILGFHERFHLGKKGLLCKKQMESSWPACLLNALQILISNMSIRKEWLIEKDYSFLGRLVLCWKEMILHITRSSKQSSFTELCREIFGWVLLSSWSMRWKSSVL